MIVCTERRSVNGGCTETSTAVVVGRRQEVATASGPSAIASKWLWCIFQLPLMSGLRSGIRGLPQGGRGRAGRPARAARATLRRRWRRGRRPSARPNWASGGGAVAAADDGEARVSATASATVRVPASKRGSSNTPIGPFQSTVRASRMTSANSAAVPGPMSRPIQPSGMVAPELAHLAAGVRVADLAARAERGDVGGQVDGVGPRRAAPGTCSTWSSSNSEAPTGWPWAARNVKHMPPPTISVSATLEQGLDHAELVAHLGARRGSATNGRFGSSRSRAGPRPPWPAADRRR